MIARASCSRSLSYSLSLRAATGDKSVVSIAQTLLRNAAKSFKNFKYLQRAMAIEETEEKRSCLDMPYRHLTKLSTRTNMIHMNIGDKGKRVSG
jgi:hypothetical protein